jgi:hypothetical protein
LPKPLLDQCLSLWWFKGWIDELKAKRKTGSEDGPPDTDEQVHMLIANHPDVAPRKGQAVTIERLNGASYELNGHSLLERIAPNFHGEDVSERSKAYVSPRLQQQILVLPWSDDWVAVGRKRREVARMRKLITKEMKLEYLLFFFKEKKPVWKSRIPIFVPDGSGDVFEFFPGTWLDDICDNWLNDSRANVVLTKAQMGAIETLPWFSEWIDVVREQRSIRDKNRKRSAVKNHESDISETYETDHSQQENAPRSRKRAKKTAPPILFPGNPVLLPAA